MADLKQFMVRYRHNGGDWSVMFFAADLDDAQRKFRSMAGNGEVFGPILLTAPAPVPHWIMRPFLNLSCAVLNAWAKFRKWMKA